MNRTTPSVCRPHGMCVFITMPTDLGQNKSHYNNMSSIPKLIKCSRMLESCSKYSHMNLRKNLRKIYNIHRICAHSKSDKVCRTCETDCFTDKL